MAIQPFDEEVASACADRAEPDTLAPPPVERPTTQPSPPPVASVSPAPAVEKPTVPAGPQPGAPTESARVEEKRKSTPSNSVLRVDSRRIDDLLNLVSETVINKAAFNQIHTSFLSSMNAFESTETRFRDALKELFDSLPSYLDEIQAGESPKEVRKRIVERFGALPSQFNGFHSELKGTVGRFHNTSQNLGRIAGELQEGVMRIRMVPIAQIFSRFPRLVRDLSKALNKQINLVIEGEDTELDKSVIEDLLDPLIHCVRNSIDHGVEDAETRRAAGKPDSGTVTLRASNEGNMIVIEISDDVVGSMWHPYAPKRLSGGDPPQQAAL